MCNVKQLNSYSEFKQRDMTARTNVGRRLHVLQMRIISLKSVRIQRSSHSRDNSIFFANSLKSSAQKRNQKRTESCGKRCDFYNTGNDFAYKSAIMLLSGPLRE